MNDHEEDDRFEASASDDGVPGLLVWNLPTSIILLMFAGLALSGLPFLSFDDDLESLFRGDTREFRDYKKFSQMFFQ